MPTILTEAAGNTLIVTASKDLGEFISRSLETEGDNILRQLDEPHFRNVLMDLTSTDYCGSSALNLFLKIEQKLRDKGGQLVLVGLSPHAMEILHITKLEGRWRICKSRVEALATLGCGALKAYSARYSTDLSDSAS